jgi:DNA-binding MarR family transcriptional regulator
LSVDSQAPDEAGAESLTFDGLNVLLGFHLRQAQGNMHRQLLTILGDLELTQKQSAMLWLIGANPGSSQIGLGGALRIDRATTMTVIDRLDERGLIVRQRSKIDRRRHEIYLTPEGQKLLVKVKARLIDHEQQFAQRFSAEELTTFVGFLERLYDR